MKQDQIKEIASIAWKGAANAFRMYPDNKHTFAEYWDAAKSQFEQYVSPLPSKEVGQAADEWTKENAKYVPDEQSEGMLYDSFLAGANWQSSQPSPSNTEVKALREALGKVANWELPETGKYWDRDQKEPMSYEAAYGSNGARDYFKLLAANTLKFSQSLPSTEVQDDWVKVEALFDRFVQFALKTFVNATAKSSLTKLSHEVEEVVDAYVQDKDPTEEYVDCIMCLLDSAARCGITMKALVQKFAEKTEINISREWKENEDGTYSHVKAPGSQTRIPYSIEAEIKPPKSKCDIFEEAIKAFGVDAALEYFATPDEMKDQFNHLK